MLVRPRQQPLPATRLPVWASATMGKDCRHSSVQVHGGTNAGAKFEPGNGADEVDEAEGSDASAEDGMADLEEDEDAMIRDFAQDK